MTKSTRRANGHVCVCLHGRCVSTTALQQKCPKLQSVSSLHVYAH